MVIQPSFRDTILIFFRRKLVFLAAFLVVCGLGAAYLVLATPKYVSSASLILRFEARTVPQIDRNLDAGPQAQQGVNEHREVLHSDAAILTSPDLAREAIRTIGLDKLYPKIAASKLSDARKRDAALQSFQSDLVVNVGLESDVITVSFLAREPHLAQAVVQHLLTEFYGQEASIYANPQLRFAQQEAIKGKEKLTDAQNVLSAFKQSHQIADLQVQVQQFLQQRTDVTSRLAISQGALLQAQQQEIALKELLATVPTETTSSAQGEQYQSADSAEGELDRLRAKRSQMLSTYTPTSPVLRQLDAQINSLDHAVHTRTGEGRKRVNRAPNKVYESIKTDYLRAQAQARSAGQPVAVAQAQLDDINKRLAALEQDQNRYADLTRAVQIQSDTYRALAIRDQEAQIEASRNAEKISAATVIAAPALADKPSHPRKKLVAGASVLLGLLFGAGLVLALEAFDDRLRTPREVAHVLRLPILATFGKDA